MRSAEFWGGVMYGVIVTFVIIGAVWFYWQNWERAREMSKESSCMSGLLEIRPLIWDFRKRHQGKFPLKLEELDWQKATPDAKGGCPKVRGKFPPGEGWRGYLYISPRDDTPEDTPILLCWRHDRLLALTKGGHIKRWDK